MTDTLLFAAILVPSLIVAIVFHEVAHGWMALALGDPTAREERRLSLNPLRHVDPVGTLVVPGALALFGGPIFGWAKPVPVRRDRLDNPRFGMMAVAAAGPGINLLLALAGAVLLGLALPPSFNDWAGTAGSVLMIQDGAGGTDLLATGLFYFILVNVFLALFNLLPIPPFDGSHIVEGLLPRRIARYWQKLQAAGMLLLLLLVAMLWLFPQSNAFAQTVFTPVIWTQERFLEIAQAIGTALS